MPRKPDPPELKVAKKLKREYTKLEQKRHTPKVFKKDVRQIARELNKDAREIAKKTKGKKVLDVQEEIIRNLQELY